MITFGGKVMSMIRRSMLLLVWQLAASVALLLLGGIAQGLPVWLLGRFEAMQQIGRASCRERV